jgi:outer membrane protein assembly factor BamB
MIRLVLAVLVLSMGGYVSADWPRFRGFNGQGLSQDVTIPTQFDEKNLLWKTPIPGLGHSSPIVSLGKVFLQTATEKGDERLLMCLDEKTGAILWSKSVAGEKSQVHKKSSLANGTPVADGERVIVAFWTGQKVITYAYDYAGNDLWKYELGGHISEHGASITPIVHGGLVYINYDQDGASEVVCLDAKTGEKKWATPRKAHRTVYTPPLIRILENGKPEVIVTSTTCISGYDAISGKVSWNWDWSFEGKQLRTAAVPLLIGNTLIQFSGDGAGTRNAVALDLSSSLPKVQWQIFKYTTYVPAGVILGDHLYLVTDAGLATCLEWKTGKMIWQERALTKAVSASTILVQDQVLALAEDGQAVAFRATPKGYEKLSDSRLNEAVFATPAATNGKLIIRGANTVSAYGPKDR